jgi:peroxiredoxin
MSDIVPLVPRQQVPPLSVPLVGGGAFELAAEKPERFLMLVFYRGLHCPQCARYLRDLESKLAEFDKRGVKVLALSSDTEERAERAKEDWSLDDMRVGYGLTLKDARAWGLYVSTGRGKTSVGVEEPALFSEPGLFLVRPDGTLYWSAVQTMPFSRPHFSDVLSALDFVIDKNYPARGEVAELPQAAE